MLVPGKYCDVHYHRGDIWIMLLGDIAVYRLFILYHPYLLYFRK